MNFVDTIKDNSILIIPNNIKNKVLDKIGTYNDIRNIKIMSFNDLKYGFYFDYGNKTIYEVMKKYNLTYNIAKSYIDMIYFIEDEDKDNDKYHFLKGMKKFLEDNDLLTKDKLFIPLLNSKSKLYVYGFSYINKFNTHLLDKISKYIPYEIIEVKNSDYHHEVYEFKTIEDEVSYVAENISTLIDNGVDINKIYIANYGKEYYFTINYIFDRYNIPLYMKSDTTLFSTIMGKYFLNNLDKKSDLLLEEIKKKFNIKNITNEKVFNKLKALLDTYYWCDNLSDIKDLVEEELKHIRIPKRHYKNEVKIVDITDNIFNDDEYVFLINFNLGNIPKLKRDEDYLNDAIKPSVLETTDEDNRITKECIITSIKNIKNLTITYKLADNFTKYEPSFLIENEIFTKRKSSVNYSKYSNKYNELLLARLTDNLVKFNEKDERIPVLNNTYKIDYKTYNNSFNGVDNSKLINKIDNNLNFSYSNIDTYYKCPFRFYLNSILKVLEYKEMTIDQFIGSLFHYCLERCVNSDEDPTIIYDEYVNNNLDKRTFTNADKFYIERLKEEITFIINTIKEQYKHSSHNNEEHEKKIEIEERRKITYKLKGYVDKILYYNNNAFIIDYKTNNKDSDKTLYEYGINIQLSMYLYLLKRIDNIDVAGMYLQHILNLDINYEPNKDMEDLKRNNLKLVGYTLDDTSVLTYFDDTYENSSVIRSLKAKKDGTWYGYSKVIDNDERTEIYNLMERLIYNAIDNISDGKFDIHPIEIEKKCDGCDFCQYKDICFIKPKDKNTIKITIDKGDDDNA